MSKELLYIKKSQIFPLFHTDMVHCLYLLFCKHQDISKKHVYGHLFLQKLSWIDLRYQLFLIPILHSTDFLFFHKTFVHIQPNGLNILVHISNQMQQNFNKNLIRNKMKYILLDFLGFSLNSITLSKKINIFII